MRDVIQQVRAQGVIVVAAAGNDSLQQVGTPANCQGAIAVSALAYSGVLARYSNVGPEVVVTAPGGDTSRQSPSGPDAIMSTHATFASGSATRTPNYAGMQGTSMATPHVAGVMALMRAVKPAITPAEVDTLFGSESLTDRVGTQTGRNNQLGFGMINALKAITAAGSGTPPPPPSGLPTLALSTTQLSFGTITNTLPITLTRINNSNDFPVSATDTAARPAAVTVTGLPGVGSGPSYVLNVNLDRLQLNTGEDQIQVELTSNQGRKIRFDVAVAPRSTIPPGLRGVGPVYVLAVDPNTHATLGQANVTANAITYPYTLSNLTGPVIIMAGTDTDNDGFICGASEPCGAYPVLGAEFEPTTISSGRSGVNFDLLGGGSAAGLGIGGLLTQSPGRGFARIR